MPRQARVVADGVPHHITQRGNNRQEVFLLDEDRRFYLDHPREQARHNGVRLLGAARPSPRRRWLGKGSLHIFRGCPCFFYLAISGYTKYQFYMGRKKEPGPSGEAPTKHFENFIKAVRSRKTSDQNGPVETAHLAAGMAHLGNIALMRGGMLEFDPAQNRFTNDEEANKMLGQKYRKGFEVPAPDKV